MSRASLLILFVMLATSLFANEADKEGKVKGAVIEQASDVVVEYATVALYSSETNDLITGTITDHTGNFKIDKVPFGTYFLKISFIGYYDKTIESVVVNEENKNINLGNIELESAAKELGEVEVVAKQASIDYRIDKKVINVDKQITAESGNSNRCIRKCTFRSG